MGIEGFRRLWALVDRVYPAADDLSVAEVAENQCEAYKTLLLQVCVCERERAHGREKLPKRCCCRCVREKEKGRLLRRCCGRCVIERDRDRDRGREGERARERERLPR